MDDKLETLSAQVAFLVQQEKKRQALFDEAGPLLKEVMSTAVARFDELEKKGYFDFGRELLLAGQRVVEGYSADDVRQFADALVGILDTVRALTQPEVLKLLSDTSAVVARADQTEPLGLLGMVRATRSDEVQRGMAVLMEILRKVGQGVQAMTARPVAEATQKARLAAVLAPKSKRKVLGIERPVRAATPAARHGHARPDGAPSHAAPVKPTAMAAAKPATTLIDGVAFTADGHLADPKAWTRGLAETLAATQGVALDDARWAVLNAARDDFAKTGMSPNIRRLTQVSQVSTKDLYSLFPKAPGRTVAKIAGLPKPVGCI
ncbi:MAG: TusE/DsrC/DsvC family sulfur relay protein [Deltaproteobacteria bacterium]|nr:TusE/DsrC/DsvC family sulfur relay protein [Deltaproteobacteria bacterium]